ncbi:MAG: CocE/NonD family hydrolase [Lachnospiraceae bacterium]|nr:CocE/NonD family hydrolase [Lachnospiraceae bacterium]
MRMKWNFYLSGILYGKFHETAEGVTTEKLNIETGEWLPEEKLTEETDAYFRNFCSRSILEFFQKKQEYENYIAEGKEEFITSSGEQFSKRREEAYIQRNKKFGKDLLYEQGKIYGVLMPGRDYTAVLAEDGKEEKTVLKAWSNLSFQEIFQVKFHGTFFVETRDGERLATDVYLPIREAGANVGKVPAVLVRTPYGKGNHVEMYYRFVRRGYAVVIQDTRGREDSTGRWQPNYYEVEDGDDTLNWIAAQDWSDGQTAMTGGSYLGYVQWAAAASGNPHLKAMLSSVCAGSAFADLPRRGGCFTSGMLAWAFAMSEQRMREDLMCRKDWDDVLDLRPLETIPEKALGREIPFLTEWLKHEDLDDFWKRSSWKERYSGPPVPALIMSGWFDDNGMGTTEALDLVRDWPEGTWKAILGPWKHSGNAEYDLHGIPMGEDALRYDIDLICMMWLEHFLKGVENGIEKNPKVLYYTLGENRWKTAETWPPQCVKIQRMDLHSEKNSYVYDPDCPATHIIDMSENELEVPEDYTEEEKREDYLIYSTEVLKEPVTVTGDVQVHLLVSCDCPDTDFVFRLLDVDENGRSVKLADGVISAKYREGFERPVYMEAGNVYEIPLRTTKISNTFLPGHRIRFTVTSSAKNFIFPNSNTEKGFNSEKRQKAHITVHQEGEFCSYVELPIEQK